MEIFSWFCTQLIGSHVATGTFSRGAANTANNNLSLCSVHVGLPMLLEDKLGMK